MACRVIVLGYKGARQPSPILLNARLMDFAEFRTFAADLPGPAAGD
jgi:hypothetical protein